MREVFLIVGPRASGKSTFCEKVTERHPAVTLVSRDKMLTELCGKTDLDPYSGDHQHVAEKMWKEVEELLSSSSEIQLILDTWNGYPEERRAIIAKLRRLGVDRVEAWYFITPVEFVAEWFWRKPGIAKMGEMRNRTGEGLTFYSESAPRRDHEVFHELAASIESEGFDAVMRINPLTMGPEHVLALQASLDL